MSGLDSLDQFFEPGLRRKQQRSFSKKQIRKMSKKQLRSALANKGQRQTGRRQSGEDGLALGEIIKSKEFKERVELLKKGGRLTAKGSKVAYAKGRIAATRLASRIRKARSKSIYD